MGFLLYIITAFALVFVIEGLFYALFPNGVRKMMEAALSLPEKQLRIFGVVMAVTGFCLVLLLQKFV
ncbi:MAG: DUF2065 domain-containing protein [Alphaproteobacteria bacterium CG_4_9_14_3_um_filter_47_13]|nr:MAG: DUF2065 domain-containing protein [Alphaproteobacteria bacterium CG_4_9_14_3_um_filter_47_13]